MRILQVIPDTTDSIANLVALRHHEVLARGGSDIRTLAIAPGNGVELPPLVPTMAPSARALSAFTELRRELRWPDVVVSVDRLPRALTGRSRVPVVVMASTGSSREGLVTSAARQAVVRVIVVPDGDASSDDNAIQRLRTPFDRVVVGDGPSPASRRAARSLFGVSDDALVVAQLGAIDGRIHQVRSLNNGEWTVLGNAAPEPDDVELLVRSIDVVVPDGLAPNDPPDMLPPLLVDLMAVGAVPVGWRQGLDDGLLDGDELGHTRSAGGNDPSEDLGEYLSGLHGDPSHLDHLAATASRTARRLCHPDEIHRQWSGILGQALPSQT